MSNVNKIIMLAVGVIAVFLAVKLFIMFLPFLILAAAGYWIYRKVKLMGLNKYSIKTSKNTKKEKFDFVDADYEEVEKNK